MWRTRLLDINIVLNTLGASNKVTNLSFDFSIYGEHPFGGCLDQNWIGLYEVIRISAGEPLKLELQATVSTGKLEWQHLYTRILEKIAPLSDYPNVCIHFWNPTFRSCGLGPFPSNQVPNRCRW